MHRYTRLAPAESDDDEELLSPVRSPSPSPGEAREEDGDGAGPPDGSPNGERSWRAAGAFWLLGLCNNFAYVVMLSAAHDILKGGEAAAVTAAAGGRRDCNPISTGAVLLADILPALLIKMVSPAVNVRTGVRIAATVGLMAASFALVATSAGGGGGQAYLGVVCASLGSGIGEVSLLAHAALYHSDTVAAWSSGTGASGVLGAASYAGLLAIGLTPRTTLLAMQACPAAMMLAFWCLLPRPAGSGAAAAGGAGREQAALSWREKVALLKYMPPLMVPLSTVYAAEYFINQGLLELVWFPGERLSHAEQYRWLQLAYQMGVFVSRSSVHLLVIRRIWVLSLLQAINAGLLLLEAVYLWTLPWAAVAALVLWEGLLGGAAYVNTFHGIHRQFAGAERAFVLGTVSLADSLGVAVAGVVALPVHDAICRVPVPG